MVKSWQQPKSPATSDIALLTGDSRILIGWTALVMKFALNVRIQALPPSPSWKTTSSGASKHAHFPTANIWLFLHLLWTCRLATVNATDKYFENTLLAWSRDHWYQNFTLLISLNLVRQSDNQPAWLLSLRQTAYMFAILYLMYLQFNWPL
jgi:hypothetical protein